MIVFSKPPTDEEIQQYTFSNTFQEASPEIKAFVEGMKLMRDIWANNIKEEEA